MSYGRNLLNKMNYPRSRLFFKSDVPHLINYFNEYKHMYFIDTKEHYSRIKTTKMNKSQQPAKINHSTPSKYINTSSVSADSESSNTDSSYYFTNKFSPSMQYFSQYGYNPTPIYYNTPNYLYYYY